MRLSEIKHKSNIYGKFIALAVVISLILLGPVEAVMVSLSQPNDADKGSDVSFSATVEIKDSDLLPIEYTEIILSGPDGFSKTCKIYSDGTDNCDDVDVTVSKSSLSDTYGYQYGLDENIGYGYNLGTGYGYKPAEIGSITYDVVWHTSSDLTDGTYDVQIGVYAVGSDDEHTYDSSAESFTISTAAVSTPVSGGGGGGGGGSDVNVLPATEEITVQEMNTEENTVQETTTPNVPTENNEAGMEAITGAATTDLEGKGFFSKIPVPLIVSIGAILGGLLVWGLFFRPKI